MAARLDVGAPRALAGPGGSRVAAQVGEQAAWFESPDLDLAPIPEAFGSAFLIPAAACGRALSMEGPVSGVWANGAAELLEIAEG